MTVSCLSILAATAKNGVIGKHNTLPWHLPADLRRFKSLTMGHAIIMGRKTYESIGRPLPGRTNIIVTKQTDFRVAGATVAHSLDDAFNAGGPAAAASERFVIGGAQLYRQAIALSQRMYLTEIQRTFDGDTYFPEFDRDEWYELSREQHFSPINTANEAPLEYHFVILERKKAKQPVQ
ncbi:dihydrofolate reductase [Nitrosomonas sp. Nm51]|uniref:dihydrofolate reductase n=1 Tax=Nitrosomonas sp. Nm51 TaxID=133720 RepID=UPI0008ACD23E|nr:dihydrofolate reductase [Nitrosomonas sp. Nm51]SER52124.1 dihydrofolate reductase [Nitrosomonas sp. Nm51]